MKTNNKGFSLVELMVVVAIIGLLAAIAVPQFEKFQARAKAAEANASLSALYTAEQAFFVEWNGYGTSFADIGYAPSGEARFNTGFTTGSDVCPGAFRQARGLGGTGCSVATAALVNTVSLGGVVSRYTPVSSPMVAIAMNGVLGQSAHAARTANVAGYNVTLLPGANGLPMSDASFDIPAGNTVNAATTTFKADSVGSISRSATNYHIVSVNQNKQFSTESVGY